MTAFRLNSVLFCKPLKSLPLIDFDFCPFNRKFLAMIRFSRNQIIGALVLLFAILFIALTQFFFF